MKSRSCDLVRRVGAADSATPHPDPSGGQAPALRWLRGYTQANEARGGFCQAQPNPSGGKAPRLAKSSTALHWLRGTHRRMRLVADFARSHAGPSGGRAPALHWLRGALRRMRLVGDSATPLLRPSGGQAPALHFPIPTPLDSGLRRNDELGAGLTMGCRESRTTGHQHS